MTLAHTAQAPLSGSAAAVIGLAALAVVVTSLGWRVIRHGTVMAHEGAHAIIGSLLLRKISGIELHRDATGGTLMAEGGCLGSILVSFAGYVGPSLFGLGAARLIQLGHAAAVLWLALVLLGLLLAVLNRSWGMVTVVVVGVLVYLMLRFTSPGARTVGSYGITWLLLLSGVRRVVEIGILSEDGVTLKGLTHLPRWLWFLLWLGATLAALVVGGRILLTPA